MFKSIIESISVTGPINSKAIFQEMDIDEQEKEDEIDEKIEAEMEDEKKDEREMKLEEESVPEPVPDSSQKPKYQGILDIVIDPVSRKGPSKKASNKKLSSLKISPVKIEQKVITVSASIAEKKDTTVKYEHLKNVELKAEIKKIDPKYSLSKITTKDGLIKALIELKERKVTEE